MLSQLPFVLGLLYSLLANGNEKSPGSRFLFENLGFFYELP